MTNVVPLANARSRPAESAEPESYRRLQASPGMVSETIKLADDTTIEVHHSPAMARTIGPAWLEMAETAERMEADGG
jgi:hypothetical protein